MTNSTCLWLLGAAFVTTLACSTTTDPPPRHREQPGSGGNGSGASGGSLTTTGGSGVILNPGTGGSAGGGDIDNPATCSEAASNRSYIGCEFWPTVTYNPLYSEFDFAVVLANGGAVDAEVTVTGPNNYNQTATVKAGELTALTLPWVDALKGPEFSRTNTSEGRIKTSVRADASAYRVVSSVPVTAWQFSPLQYKKPLSEFASCGVSFGTSDCFSVSNDASLLVPTTAMTGNYRVFGRSEILGGAAGQAFTSSASAVAITATKDNTTVTLEFPKDCGAASWTSGTLGDCVAAGSGVTAAKAGDKVTFTLNAGDVLQLLGAWAAGDGLKHADLSGTVINATAPVQVIALNPITNIPGTATNADHIEETVLPAEVIGKKYIVTPPTAPEGAVKGGHVVRIYGNVNGTTLSYPEGQPTGAPTTIDAGAVVEFGPTTEAFVVEGTQPFVVASFMLGGSMQAPSGSACPNHPCKGDPAMTMMVTPEQFRQTYTFLAPVDYETNFADVLVPSDAEVTLDDAPLGGTPEAIGASGWSIVRVPLSADTGGVHKLSTTHELGIGLQVMGFGHATAYYYPGGLNLKLISEPPVIVK